MSSQWQKIVDEVQELQRANALHGVQLWYRGEKQANWPLQSSLYRHIRDNLAAVPMPNPTGEDADRKYLREEYKTLYRKFKSKAWHLLDSMERSDWGLVFRMQHYGFPTRLLDWTKSFACAVYFAQLGRKPDHDAAIYILNPEGLNYLSAGFEALIALDESIREGNFDVRLYHPTMITRGETDVALKTIAIAPYLSNPRMVAQRAAFTMSGDSFKSLEEEFDDQLTASGYLKKIILTAETFSETQRFLDAVGIGHFGYFPDLEGLRAAHLVKKERTIQNALASYIQTSRSTLNDNEKDSQNLAATLATCAYEGILRRLVQINKLRVAGDLIEIIEVLKNADVLEEEQADSAISFLTFYRDAHAARWERISRDSIISLLDFDESLLSKLFW